MKAERRHELQTNELALWLRWRLPQLLEKYGTRLLLGLVLVVLAIILIRHRINAPKLAAAAAGDDLAAARDLIDALRTGMSTPAQGSQALKLIMQAMDRSDAPVIQADGYLALGDYYWALISFPRLPGAETQPGFQIDQPRPELLAKSEQAYQKVLEVAKEGDYRKAAAHMGLAAIAEERAYELNQSSAPGTQPAGHWAVAREHYQAVLQSDAPTLLKSQAQWHLDRLAQFQEPVWLVLPADLPQTTRPASGPATVPAAPEDRPVTRPAQ